MSKLGVLHLPLCEAIVGLGHIRTYLEIGVGEGHSLREVLIKVTGLEEVVLCDSWGAAYGGSNRGSHDHIVALLEEEGFPLSKVRFLDGLSKVLVPDYFLGNPGKRVDLCLVDADHSEGGLWDDLMNTVEQTDIVAVHDIRHPQHIYLKCVFSAFYETVRDDFIALDNGDQLGMLVRRELLGL